MSRSKQIKMWLAWHGLFRTREGLKILSRANYGVLIASRHYPWSITWSWLFAVGKRRRNQYRDWWRVAFFRDAHNNGWTWELALPFGGFVKYARQHEMPRRSRPAFETIELPGGTFWWSRLD